MDVRLFIRDDCPKCPAALRAVDGVANLFVYDVTDPTCLAEATSLRINETPSIIVTDSSGREVAGWRGKAPDASDLRAVLAH